MLATLARCTSQAPGGEGDEQWTCDEKALEIIAFEEEHGYCSFSEDCTVIEGPRIPNHDCDLLVNVETDREPLLELIADYHGQECTIYCHHVRCPCVAPRVVDCVEGRCVFTNEFIDLAR
jgi:hypothetical protein